MIAKNTYICPPSIHLWCTAARWWPLLQKTRKILYSFKKAKKNLLWKPINTKSRLINRFSATLSHAVRFNTACAVQCTQHPGRSLMIYAKIVTKRSLTTIQRFLCQLTIGHNVIHSIWRFFCNHKHFWHIWHFCMIWNILKTLKTSLTRDFVMRGNFSWFFFQNWISFKEIYILN